MDRDLIWFEMPIERQISNIGSEVLRAIKYKKKGKSEIAENFCNKAIQFWEIVKRDPKNRNRVREFEFAIEELIDYFLGDNIYNTTDEILIRYYDAFLYRI